MSFTDEYLALQKKKKKKEEQKTTGHSFTDKYLSEQTEKTVEDIAPVFVNKTAALYGVEREIAPTTTKKDERKWFEKGAFEDGYQLGDISKTILGTGTDIKEDLFAGVLGVGEAAVDFGAWLVGSAGDLLGADKLMEKTDAFVAKDLYDERKIAKKLVDVSASGVFNETVGIDTGDSVLGERADNAAYSIGQQAVVLGLQALGVPWQAAQGVIAFGSEAENALNNGAGHWQAGLSGGVSAGLAIGTGALFGGSGLGEKGLINLDSVTKGIKNDVVRTLAAYGVDMVGESAEEVIEGVASALAQQKIYAGDKAFSELFSKEDFWDAVISAGVSSGVFNLPKVTTSLPNKNSPGKDYRTGLTPNEQKVFDKVYADEVADAEKNGNLTKKEKAAIYDRVMSDLERGYISTDTIEEVLDGESYSAFKGEYDGFFGGETYKAYKDTLASEEAQIKEIEAQIKELEEAPNTVGNSKKYDALQSQIEEIKNSAKKSELKAQLDSEAARIGGIRNQLRTKVSEMVKDSKLYESYRELARKNEKFTADVSKYTNEHARKTIQNIMDSGVADNTNEFHEFADWLAQISADKGITFTTTDTKRLKGTRFYHEGYITNGFVDENGNVTLNMDSAKAGQVTVGHEITHVLKGTEFYGELEKAIKNYAVTKMGQDAFNAMLEETKARYKGKGDPDEELTADLVGEYLFTDEAFVRNLSVQHRNVFQKIYDEIKYLCKIATAGSKEARELMKVEKAFADAYRGEGKSAEGTKYSVSKETDSDYLDAVKRGDTETAQKMVDEAAKAAGYTVKAYHGTNAEFNIFKESSRNIGYWFTEDIDYARQHGRIIKRSFLKAANVLPEGELWDYAEKRFGPSVSEKQIFSKDFVEYLEKNGFDGFMFDHSGANTYIVFNPTQIKSADPVTYDDNGNVIPLSERFNPEKDDIRYSLSDSDGKQLTKEQQEYFKDSKVRDENGNLLVMYHGTSNGGHTVFDPYGKAKYGLFGAGSYFTDNKSVAESYTNKGKGNNKQVYETYLNIKNPIDMDAPADAAAWAKAMPEVDFPESGTNEAFYRAMEEYFEDAEYARWEAAEIAMSVIEGMGYDGITHIGGGRVKADGTRHRVYIAFQPEQIKNIDNTKPTADADIRYSLSDSEGKNNDFKVMDGGSVTKYSLSTWTPETQENVRANLVKAGYEKDRVDKWIKDINSVASVIAADKDRLDFVAADNQVMLKDNQEYIKTLDASTLCAKRLVYQGTFDAIQHRMPNTMLSSDDLIDLLNMMKEHNVQTPCGVCYVESRRRHLGKFAQEWLDKYNGEYKPNLDEVTTSDGLEALRKSHPQTYKDFVDAMNKKGSSNPKVVQLRTKYRNEIMSLTPAQIRKIEAIGGLRVQSFSDFETPHMLDMMQAVMDMSAKGLHSQAYTKVPNFAWVFGDTGIKINLSLIAEGNGFDADGNLAFSSTEGMDIDEAMKLRDAYSKNVGTIIVGANDKHILACMADDRIDFIIPFHRSGWGMKELDMMGMSSYTDYTYGQKEHDLATGKGVENLYPPDYWDYNLSGKENAERYLNLCAKTGREPKFSKFLVDNGDGSYSLQPDGSTDGYWKMLIDFKMYDNDGNGAAQQKVQPDFNMEEAYRVLNEYEGGANSLPVANDVVEEFVAKYQAQHSLSEVGETPDNHGLAPLNKFRYYGKDMKLADFSNPETGFNTESNTESNAENRVGDMFPDDLAPVAKPAKQEAYEAIRPKPQKEPRMAKATPTEQARADSKGKQRKWVGTSTGSEAVDGQILPEDLDQELIHYQPIPNKKTLGNANAKLDRMGYEASVTYLNSQFASNKVTLDDIALGERLIQEAVKRGDTKTAGDLIMDISILGTELGQKVQALSIIKRLTPEGQLKMLQRTVERGKTKGDKAFADVEITQEMIDHILKTYGKDGTYDQAELNKAVEDVKQKIADQMSVGALDYINEWRYLSMLGNPKTHIRNIVSNVAMWGTRQVKNAVARTIEDIAPIKNRTKTWKAASEDVKNFAKQAAIEMSEGDTDNKYSEAGSIKAKRQILPGVIGKAAKINSTALSAEDTLFSKPAFRSALSEYLTANGIKTKADIKKNGKLVAKAKQYAMEQAKEATFQQDSYIASKISEIERKNILLNVSIGAVLPFKKTPINIAKTAAAYSPLGFARNIYDAVQVGKGEMDASEAVDHLAQTLTGTSLTLIGYMLAQAGILNGAGDDDKEGKYDYQLGKQSYSFNFNGDTYSLSWLSPVAMPLFVGTNAYEQLVEGKEWNADVVFETLAQTLDPLSEMSFLSSLDSVLSSYDSGVEKFMGIFESAGQSYVTQFVPTLSSQFAQLMDDTKRSTKAAADSGFKFGEETINKIAYKIPGLRNTLEPSTDIWGNEIKQSENVLNRAFEAFIAPYARREDIATAVDEEIKDLYSQTGDTGVIPTIPNNYVSYDGEKYEMSAEDYTEFKKMYGQTAVDLMERLFRTNTYQAADSETRADMVNRVYDYARDTARKEYFSKLDVNFTNATEDGNEVYKEDPIKGAIEADLPVDEYVFSEEYPEKYSFFKQNGITYKQYASADEDGKRAYSWAYENPGKYTMSKAISDDFLTYYKYKSDCNDFDAKDKNGETVSGLKKERVIEYINGLDIDYGSKIILFRSMYDGKDDCATYNADIVEYLNGREDISYEEMETILKELGFTVDSKGNIYW